MGRPAAQFTSEVSPRPRWSKAGELSRAQAEDFEARHQEMLDLLDGAIAPNLVVQALIQIGLTTADLATATGANIRTVSSWQEQPLRPPRKKEHRIRLRQLKEVTRFMIQNGTIAYQEADWLRDPNRSADFDTPLELVGRGEWRRAGRAFCDDVAAQTPPMFLSDDQQRPPTTEQQSLGKAEEDT